MIKRIDNNAIYIDIHTMCVYCICEPLYTLVEDVYGDQGNVFRSSDVLLKNCFVVDTIKLSVLSPWDDQF